MESDSVKTNVEKSGGNFSGKRDLGSSLDQVTVFGQLGGHGHVHKLVCNAHHHATDNGRVDSVGNKSLLSRFKESSKGSLNLLLVGSIKLLGSGDCADHLSSVRRHQGVEGGNDGLGEAKSVVLSQGLEQVLAQLVHLQSLAHSADAVKLDVVLDRWVQEE